jgi:1-acyl-sn-glycerol-3-phosphate acyltransferase
MQLFMYHKKSMPNLLRVFVIIVLVCLTSFLAWCGANTLARMVVVQLVTRLIPLTTPVVIGSLDPRARVISFNHPSHLEQIVMLRMFHGSIRGLARDMHKFVVVNPILKAFDCVLVRRQGGQNTTQRIRNELSKASTPILIATSILDMPQDVCHAGALLNKRMPHQIPSIAFRLGARVQPVAIIYRGLDVVPSSSWDLLRFIAYQRKRAVPYVFVLPSVDPSDYPSPEACAKAVRDAMDAVIQRYEWLIPSAPPDVGRWRH